MRSVGISLLMGLWSSFRSRAELQTEIVALHHQLAVLRRRPSTRPQLRPADRFFWTWLSRQWRGWRRALVIGPILVKVCHPCPGVTKAHQNAEPVSQVVGKERILQDVLPSMGSFRREPARSPQEECSSLCSQRPIRSSFDLRFRVFAKPKRISIDQGLNGRIRRRRSSAGRNRLDRKGLERRLNHRETVGHGSIG